MYVKEKREIKIIFGWNKSYFFDLDSVFLLINICRKLFFMFKMKKIIRRKIIF